MHSPLRDDYTSNNNIHDNDDSEDSDENEPIFAVYAKQAAPTNRRPPPEDSNLDDICRRINNSPTTQTTTNNNTEIDFDTRNDEYVPQLIDNLPPPLKHEAEEITKVLVALGCDTPRPYQIDCIFQLTFRKLDMMYLIRKCGDGKSLVMHAMATILRGITIVMVPLIGLGNDQISKTKRPELGVEAYHIDEFRDDDASKLTERLETYDPDDNDSIIIYISPQNLRPTTKWYKKLVSLAEQGFISSICIDEAHVAVEDSDSFRPEFKDGIESINNLIDISNKNNQEVHIPILVMDATFRISEQQTFNKLIHRIPDVVCWGPMDKRNVGIFNHVAGNPLTALVNDWSAHVLPTPDRQSLLMSNSAQACEGSILSQLEKARDKLPDGIKLVHPIDIDDEDTTTQSSEQLKEFIPFTGDIGLMMKSYLMDCFCGDDSDGDDNLPMIWCMPCTSAANCGVSSKRCNKCYRHGLPPNWKDLVQEMGRVDRAHDAKPGEHGYYIYQNVTTYPSLWIRSQRQTNPDVRNRHEKQLYEVMKSLMLPDRCYHEVVEEMFENPATYKSRGPCGNLCSYCTGDHKNFSGAISKERLVGHLQTNIFHRGAVRADEFVKFLTDKSNMNKIKKSIWGETNAPPGMVHGLVLMLLAADLIKPRLVSKDKVGTNDIKMKDVELILCKHNDQKH